MDWCWFSSIIPRRPCKLPPKTGWSFSPRICAMPLKNGPCKVVCFGSQVEGVYTNLCYREATIFWLVVSNIFYVQPELLGRWTHFDEHIFQRGWNHQLYSFNYSPGVNWPVLSKKSVGKMSFWNPIGWDILVSWGVTKSIQIKSYMIIYICIYIYVCAAAQPQQDSSFGMCVCVCFFWDCIAWLIFVEAKFKLLFSGQKWLSEGHVYFQTSGYVFFCGMSGIFDHRYVQTSSWELLGSLTHRTSGFLTTQ